MAVLFPGWVENQEQKQGAEERKEVREALKYVGDSIEADGEGKKKIALTFDDGPNARWTPVLLDGLKERGIKATFFLIGC